MYPTAGPGTPHPGLPGTFPKTSMLPWVGRRVPTMSERAVVFLEVYFKDF